MKLAILSIVALHVIMAADQANVRTHGCCWIGETSTLSDHVKAASIPIFTSAMEGQLDAFKKAISAIDPVDLCFDSDKHHWHAVKTTYDAIIMGVHYRKYSKEAKQFATDAIRAMWEYGAPAQCPQGFLASRILHAGLSYDLAIEAFELHHKGNAYLLGTAFKMNLGEISQDTKLGFIRAYLETERGTESLRKDVYLFTGVMDVLDVRSQQSIDLMTELITKGARISRYSMTAYAGKYLWAADGELPFFETFFNMIPQELLGVATEEVRKAFKEHVMFNAEHENGDMQKALARKFALLKIIDDRRN